MFELVRRDEVWGNRRFPDAVLREESEEN